MKIALGCDHGGYELKEEVKRYLSSRGVEVRDFGTGGPESVDYPDFAAAAARAVAAGECARGVLVCKSGIGMCIAANKVRGIRAALCLDEEMAELSRRHNDANVLVLSGSRTRAGEARGIVEKWLCTPFEGGRHERRIGKIREMEEGE